MCSPTVLTQRNGAQRENTEGIKEVTLTCAERQEARKPQGSLFNSLGSMQNVKTGTKQGKVLKED